MPEHIHLLVSEPEVKDLAKAIQALKISVARRRMRYHDKDGTTLWQKRYYDHNVRTYESFVEKLRYIHRNPVKRGFVARPGEWKWSSFRHYRMAEAGVVEIESQWTSDRREGRTGIMLRVPNQ
jgi:putative transposase